MKETKECEPQIKELVEIAKKISKTENINYPNVGNYEIHGINEDFNYSVLLDNNRIIKFPRNIVHDFYVLDSVKITAALIISIEKLKSVTE